MSKKKYMSWSEAEAVAPIFSIENLPIMHRQYQFKHFEGNLLTLIEGIGLTQKQEDAIKSYARRELWDFVREGYVISDDEDKDICESTSGGSNPKDYQGVNPKVSNEV